MSDIRAVRRRTHRRLGQQGLDLEDTPKVTAVPIYMSVVTSSAAVRICSDIIGTSRKWIPCLNIDLKHHVSPQFASRHLWGLCTCSFCLVICNELA